MLKATFENTTKELQKAVREGKIKTSDEELRKGVRCNKLL